MTMMRKVKIAPSILSADFGCLAKDIQKVDEAGADWIHIDVMDGHFVPNLTMGAPIVKAIRSATSLPFDVHLMVSNPERLIGDFAKAGADILTVHTEAVTHLHRIVQSIRELGVKAGVSLNPATPLCAIEEICQDVDMILLMSVNPGFGGQKFIPTIFDKLERLQKMRQKQQASFLIQIDGGVNETNAGQLIQSGADVLVAGSAVYGAADIAKAIAVLRG